MPEASVHEDRHLGSPEDDVGLAPQTGQRPLVYSVPQPSCVQT